MAIVYPYRENVALAAILPDKGCCAFRTANQERLTPSLENRMNSRGFSIFVTLDEWVDIVLKVHSRTPIYGVIHYWPNHAYEFLTMDSIRQQVSIGNACDVMIRTLELDRARGPKRCFEERPTVEGMVHLDVPKIWQDERLLNTYCAIRPSDTREGIVSPVALFNALKREFLRIRRNPLFRSDSGESLKQSGYTKGALGLFDKGVQLSNGALDSLIYIPAERWPGFNVSMLKIGS